MLSRNPDDYLRIGSRGWKMWRRGRKMDALWARLDWSGRAPAAPNRRRKAQKAASAPVD